MDIIITLSLTLQSAKSNLSGWNSRRRAHRERPLHNHKTQFKLNLASFTLLYNFTFTTHENDPKIQLLRQIRLLLANRLPDRKSVV